MNFSNIIKILPNIYLGNKSTIDLEFIKNNFIKTIVLTNNDLTRMNNDEISKLNNFCNLINININPNLENIDFNYTNNLILSQITHKENILIISNENLLGFIITSAFMINYLDISFFKILILDKAYDIGILNTNKKTNANIYKLLYEYYCKKKNFL